MADDNWTWSIDEIIPNQKCEGDRIQGLVLDQLRNHNWHDDDIFGINLALEEALVNAIKHGNQDDCSKQVRLKCKLSSQRLWVEVTDEGTGFNPGEVPDPTNKKHIHTPSGRGLLLMRSFMSHVEFNSQGNVVTMEKIRD